MLSQTAVKSYQQNSVNTADPIRLVVMAYNAAIAGCRQHNLERMNRAIKELINGLSMDIAPLAGNLLGLYNYCGELARKKKFDEAANILQELRDAWATASANKQSHETGDGH